MECGELPSGSLRVRHSPHPAESPLAKYCRADYRRFTSSLDRRTDLVPRRSHDFLADLNDSATLRSFIERRAVSPAAIWRLFVDPASLQRQVFNAFDPRPLRMESSKPGEDFHQLHVDLDSVRGDHATVQGLLRKIQLSDAPKCQVLAGHAGSGKSTELSHLKSLLEDVTNDRRFATVVCNTDEDLDRYDIDFPDLLLAMIRQVTRQLAREPYGVKLAMGFLAQRINSLKEVLKTPMEVSSVDLDVGLASITTAVKTSPSLRRTIRNLVDSDAGPWMEAANQLFDSAVSALTAIEGNNWAGLVIIVDGLDKMVDREVNENVSIATGDRKELSPTTRTTERLFVHRSAQMTGLRCHVVYTMPLTLAYSHHEKTIESNYGGRVSVLPMAKISQKPPSNRVHAPGQELFREMIGRRLAKISVREEDVFESTSDRDEIIRLSGGQPTELMRLIAEAVVRGGLPIKDLTIRQLVVLDARSFARNLKSVHWNILDEIQKSGRFVRDDSNESVFRELLDMRAILQYVNDDEWYGVNPIVESIDRNHRNVS